MTDIYDRIKNSQKACYVYQHPTQTYDELKRLEQENELLKCELSFLYSRVSMDENTARISLEALRRWVEWMRGNLFQEEPVEHHYAMIAIRDIELQLKELEERNK